MKKWQLIIMGVLLITLILFILLAVRYTSMRSTVREAYAQQYVQCMEKHVRQFEESGAVLTEPLEDSYVKECLDNGGCFDGCGSACPLEDPNLTILDWLAGETKPKTCPSVCVPQCFYPLLQGE